MKYTLTTGLKISIIFLIVVLLAIILFGCKKEKVEEENKIEKVNLEIEKNDGSKIIIGIN